MDILDGPTSDKLFGVPGGILDVQLCEKMNILDASVVGKVIGIAGGILGETNSRLIMMSSLGEI